MLAKADVCIIGAGVMGSAAAYWLSRASHLDVLVVDQYGLANEYCSSNDANRVFRYAYGSNGFYTDMAVKSRQLWRDLERETSQTLLVPSGLLMLKGEDQEANTFAENSYDLLSKKSLGAERLEERDIEKRFPQFTPTEAVFDPNGGTLLASKSLALFGSLAKQNKTRFLENTRVTRIDPGNPVKLWTHSEKEIQCRIALVTTGPWSSKLISEGAVSVSATRQQVVYFNPEDAMERYRPSRFPAFFADQYYGLPAAGIEGVKVSHKGIRAITDPYEADRAADAERMAEYRSVCQRFLPELANKPIASARVCLYDMTSDSDFVIGALPENPNIVYGYGFSGHGFKFSILIGKILAELASGKPPSFEVTRLSPSRTPGPTLQPVA